MDAPRLLETKVRDESYAGVTYHIEGELVPVLHVDVATMPVFFEHHILLWKDTTLDIGVKPLQGMVKRMLAGMPIFITKTIGSGRISFSRDGPGQIVPIHMKAGDALDVREHQFLAATDNLDYGYTRVRGISNILAGQTGLFIDHFSCPSQDGILWLHGYGNVFELTLKEGEQIDIEGGGWIYKDKSVQMKTIYQNIRTSFLAGAGRMFWNRFTGPGRIGIQSMYLHLPTTR